jgi:putative molybdopterin biosynthesis protein
MSDQEQFLDVIDRDEAERRFRSALTLAPMGIEKVAVRDTLGRIHANDVIACIDGPAFDRSSFDGYTNPRGY